VGVLSVNVHTQVLYLALLAAAAAVRGGGGGRNIEADVIVLLP
jgi:hypothetical protein